MKKVALNIEVEVVGSVIRITQPDVKQERDDVVEVSPDQVVQLIEWLRECRDKIQNPESP